MKMDKDYTSITVCPETRDMLTQRDTNNSDGICPRCGHKSQGTFSHKERMAGRWQRPSILEWIKGARREFITKESQDELIDALRGNSNQPDNTQPDNTQTSTVPGSYYLTPRERMKIGSNCQFNNNLDY